MAHPTVLSVTTSSTSSSVSLSNSNSQSPAASEIRKIAAVRRRPSDNQQPLDANATTKALTLEQLVEQVDELLKTHPELTTAPLNKRPVFHDLLERYSGDMRELERFAYTDTSKNYTRNLIATDHETYALILIVWNRSKYSPIHDHPCDGCWVKVLAGAINEVRYEVRSNALVETANVTLRAGVTYMDDSMGLHKIGNPSATVDAVTLHLYSPPYDKCRVWLDSTDATKSSVAHAYYFSEFGERADY